MFRNHQPRYLLLLMVLILSCSLPGGNNSIEDEMPAEEAAIAVVHPTQGTAPTRAPAPNAAELLFPEDLTYLGAFRLPDTTGSSNWEYSGQALAYNPAGDPHSSDDGFQGSLFGVGHDHQMQVSEISIPAPVDSRNLEDLNTAETMQPFNDISKGHINENLSLPVVGLEVIGERLYFCYGQHMQEFEASHGYSSLNLNKPQTQGPWVLDGISNYTSNDYLFSIPENWSAAYTPAATVATGRFREGVWSGYGPALYAMNAERIDSEPLIPLLLYGLQQPGDAVIETDDSMQMDGYMLADHWMGGAWLTTDNQSALIFVGTKAMESSWYGFANGIEWNYDCADADTPACPDVPEYPYDNRGYWASAYQAQMIFYNPEDLAAVAQGELMPYMPQPYAVFDLTEFLYDPQTDVLRYKVDLVADIAYDREHGLLYLVERLADDAKSVIHVWQLPQ
ncbi:MAG: hypothetical protein JEZ00_01140 [Anaerolineaceae bacterium]|nr:hypothetical protein [Anaerolineaceae bacterium]